MKRKTFFCYHDLKRFRDYFSISNYNSFILLLSSYFYQLFDFQNNESLLFFSFLFRFMMDIIILVPTFRIRCSFWFIAGSRIIENSFKGYFFLFLATVGGTNPAGPYPNQLPNPAGQS